jgi:hypothetical protein
VIAVAPRGILAQRLELRIAFPRGRGRAMKTLVTVKLTDNTGMPQEVGTVQFIRLSIQEELQYRCHPRGILTDDQVKQIAKQLSKGKAFGNVGDLEWRETV